MTDPMHALTMADEIRRAVHAAQTTLILEIADAVWCNEAAIMGDAFLSIADQHGVRFEGADYRCSICGKDPCVCDEQHEQVAA